MIVVDAVMDLGQDINEDTSSGESEKNKDDPKIRIRHTPTQTALLNTYYKFGMVGVGQSYAAMISAVSNESNLSKDSVKVSHWEQNHLVI